MRNFRWSRNFDPPPSPGASPRMYVCTSPLGTCVLRPVCPCIYLNLSYPPPLPVLLSPCYVQLETRRSLSDDKLKAMLQGLEAKLAANAASPLFVGDSLTIADLQVSKRFAVTRTIDRRYSVIIKLPWFLELITLSLSEKTLPPHSQKRERTFVDDAVCTKARRFRFPMRRTAELVLPILCSCLFLECWHHGHSVWIHIYTSGQDEYTPGSITQTCETFCSTIDLIYVLVWYSKNAANKSFWDCVPIHWAFSTNYR